MDVHRYRRRPPPELRGFDPRQWQPRGVATQDAARLAHRMWCDARAEWVAQGNEWPQGDEVRLMTEALLRPE
jgi:hypothetical protein